jgi:putative hydrolase
MISRSSDLHTHSTVTDGTATPSEMADAAVAAGLSTWGLSDHVRAGSDWLDDYVLEVRALRRDGLRILCGVEAKMLDATGRLDLPAQLPELDYVLIADHQFPGPDAPMPPDAVRQSLQSGAAKAPQLIEQLVLATCAAVERAPFPAIVVHPFSLLPKCGLTEDQVSPELIDALADACLRVGASVEVNEKWRCPTSAILDRLRARGVSLRAGSDAHRAADVGAWSYLDEVDPL